MIASFAIIIATLAASHFSPQGITPDTIVHTQKTNAALWLLDLMPFIFAFWGQHVSSIIAREADTLIIDKTHNLWDETQKLRQQLELGNNYDKLTGLPNKDFLLQLLGRMIQKTGKADSAPDTFIQSLSNYVTKDRNTPSNPTVILFDINDFKDINSALGSHNGDILLRQIGSRLQATFNHPVSRVGGDDFVLLEARGRNQPDIIKLAKQLRELFEQPFNLGIISVMIDINIGISSYPQHGDTAENLLQHAEIAMYMCQKEKREYAFYSPRMGIHDLTDFILKTEINRALRNNELCLHFQPKINSRNQVREVEALVRWNHPERGIIPPDKFVPIIVQQRLNRELFQCILSLALTQAKEWEKDNISMRIALNLTAYDLLEPDLPEIVQKMLCDYNLKANVLKLEITETTLVENQELALKALTRLTGMGVPSSIDDFGTGYSSLAYLSSLPIAEIKIDQSFVMDMMSNRRNDKIVRAIIVLAHSLSLYTVAEGVEDAHTMEQLKAIDCDFLQGYHISRPLDASDFTAWLKAWEKGNLP